MRVVFDPAKDAVNLIKHGVSLARSAELKVFARSLDLRHAERRVRAYGLLDGDVYCLTYTLRRGRPARHQPATGAPEGVPPCRSE